MNRVPGNPGLHQGAETTRTTGWLAQQYFGAKDYESVAAAFPWDCGNEQVKLVTLSANSTVSFPTNIKRGATYVLMIKQDATGSRTLAYTNQSGTANNGTWKWTAATAPTLTTAAAKVDIISFVSDGVHMYGSAVLNF